jgi:hypothetical protein
MNTFVGFRQLGVDFPPKTPDQCRKSKLNGVQHVSNQVSHADHSILAASRFDCCLWVNVEFEVALAAVFRSKLPLVNSKQPRTFLKYAASHAALCWLLTYDAEWIWLAISEIGIRWRTTCIESSPHSPPMLRPIGLYSARILHVVQWCDCVVSTFQKFI